MNFLLVLGVNLVLNSYDLFIADFIQNSIIALDLNWLALFWVINDGLKPKVVAFGDLFEAHAVEFNEEFTLSNNVKVSGRIELFVNVLFWMKSLLLDWRQQQGDEIPLQTHHFKQLLEQMVTA